MSLENVKAFYKRLASDESFRDRLEKVKTQDEYSQILKSAGYEFTEAEFEAYTARLLDREADDGELRELDPQELEAVMGGATLPYDRKWRLPPLTVYGLPPKRDFDLF
jgi:predicted ribosomally synthesized peptide with nif11-like leader